MKKFQSWWRATRVSYGLSPEGPDEELAGYALGGGIVIAIAVAAIIAAALTRSWAVPLGFIGGWAARSALIPVSPRK